MMINHPQKEQILETSSDSFSVLQMNVLSFQYSTPASPSTTTATADDTAVDENSTLRQAMNMVHIRRIDPDLFLLEEVDTVVAPNRENNEVGAYDALAEGGGGGGANEQQRCQYHIISAAKPSDKTRTCLFLRKSKFSVIDHWILKFSEQNSQFALFCHVKMTIHGQNGVVDATTKEMLVIGQHAKAGRTNESEAIRVAHAKCVLAEMTRYAARFRERIGNRVLWLGDFNAGPHTYGGEYPCEWFPFISGATTPRSEEEKGEEKEKAEKDVALSFQSIVSQVCGEGAQHDFTTIKMRQGSLIKQTIDYILVPNVVRMKEGGEGLRAIAVSATPEEAQLKKDNYLPTTYWGSDHLSVFGVIAVF